MGVILLFITCLLLLVVLILQLSSHQKRSQALESKQQNFDGLLRKHLGSFPMLTPMSDDTMPVLEGVRVGIQIDQDHERPVFARILRDRLTELNAMPRLISLTEEVEVATTDVLLRGRIRCNGFEEMFFEAKIECLTPSGTLFKVSEKPSKADRQANLANAVVLRVLQEYQPPVAARTASVFAMDDPS
jgi:hypothetical protein